MGIEAVNVQVKIGSTTKNIQMEKGCVFENKGGKYVVDENGKLNVFDKNSNTWKETSAINMTNYQFKAFQAVANNSNEGNGIILSKKDIELAQEKYRNGKFREDMSELLPDGYRIEKPKLDSEEKYVQAYVTNGKESQSATLKFQIAELDDLKKASDNYQKNNNQATSQPVKSYTKTIGGESAQVEDTLNPDGTVGSRMVFRQTPFAQYWIDFTYGEDKKVKSVKISGDEDVNVQFDSKGRVAKVTSSGSSVKDATFEYDSQNRIIEKRYAKGGFEKYTYDAKGRMTQFTNENGVETYDYTGSKNGLPTTTESKYKSTRTPENDNASKNMIDHCKVVDITYDKNGNIMSYTRIVNYCMAYESLSNASNWGDKYFVDYINADSCECTFLGKLSGGTMDLNNLDRAYSSPTSGYIPDIRVPYPDAPDVFEKRNEELYHPWLYGNLLEESIKP